MKGYTTREVAEVLGLPTSSILAWTRRGLITPERGSRGSYVFTFQDIVLLRATRELLTADVPPRKVRAAIEALREQLPVGRPLSAVTISAVGDRILVRDDDAVWEPDSGQLQIDFKVAEIAQAAAPVIRRAFEERSDDDSLGADDWYDTALDLEAVGTDEAITAYDRALALDPHHADAHLNLGRLLHELGRLAEAEAHYRTACATDPRNGRARYNLGVALEDEDRPAEAIEAYEAALGIDPRLAVAHFNLARLLEEVGRGPEAIGHLAAYKKLVGGASGVGSS